MLLREPGLHRKWRELGLPVLIPKMGDMSLGCSMSCRLICSRVTEAWCGCVKLQNAAFHYPKVIWRYAFLFLWAGITVDGFSICVRIHRAGNISLKKAGVLAQGYQKEHRITN